jgi:hypothetical protein
MADKKDKKVDNKVEAPAEAVAPTNGFVHAVVKTEEAPVVDTVVETPTEEVTAVETENTVMPMMPIFAKLSTQQLAVASGTQPSCNWDNPRNFASRRGVSANILTQTTDKLKTRQAQVVIVAASARDNQNSQTSGHQNTYKIMPRIRNSGFRATVVTNDRTITQAKTYQEIQHSIQKPFGSRLF